MAVSEQEVQEYHESKFSSSRERVIIQSIHWSVVVLVVIAVVILSLEGHLSDSSATALLGTILGHVGTSAAQKLSSRSQAAGR